MANYIKQFLKKNANPLLRILQLAQLLSASSVKNNTNQMSADIYKQNVTTITRLVILQNFIRKKYPLRLALNNLLYILKVYLIPLQPQNLKHLPLIQLILNFQNHLFRKLLLILALSITFFPTAHTFHHMKNITTNFKLALVQCLQYMDMEMLFYT